MEEITTHGIQLEGFYRGKVLRHEDGGKCKVFIPGVYPDEYNEQKMADKLPDAEMAAPLFGGCTNGNGMFSYPHIGTTVWCFFENGDQNRPVFFASTLGGEMATDNPGGGFCDVRDNVQEDDDPSKDTRCNGEDSQEHMIECGSTRVVLRESGQVDIQTFSKDNLDGGSQVTIDEDGVINVVANSYVQIEAPAVKIQATDDIEMSAPNISINADNRILLNSAADVVALATNTVKQEAPFIELDSS